MRKEIETKLMDIFCEVTVEEWEELRKAVNIIGDVLDRILDEPI